MFNRNPTFLDTLSAFDRLWLHPAGPAAEPAPLYTAAQHAAHLLDEPVDEQFTIILNAYRRDQQLVHVLRKLDGLRFCRCVLVVWNDPELDRRPSSAQHWPSIHVPVHFVDAGPNNSLNARFRPLDLVRTEAVLSMDDDFEVPNQVIELAFR